MAQGGKRGSVRHPERFSRKLAIEKESMLCWERNRDSYKASRSQTGEQLMKGREEFDGRKAHCQEKRGPSKYGDAALKGSLQTTKRGKEFSGENDSNTIANTGRTQPARYKEKKPAERRGKGERLRSPLSHQRAQERLRGERPIWLRKQTQLVVQRTPAGLA